MVDIVDSKSTALKACGFDSHLPYHFKRTQVIQCDYLFFYALFYLILQNYARLSRIEQNQIHTKNS